MAGSCAITCMPTPRARHATSRPIRPRPTIASTAPEIRPGGEGGVRPNPVHPDPPRTPPPCGPDSTEPDDRDPPPGDRPRRRGPPVPAPHSDAAVKHRDAAQQVEREGHRVFGDLLVAIAW